MPGESRIGPKGPDRRPVLATRAPLAQARGRGLEGAKSAKISLSRHDLSESGRFQPESGSPVA